MFNIHLSKSSLLMKMVVRSTLATRSFTLPSSSIGSSTVIPQQELSSKMVIPLCKSLQDCSLESFLSVLSKSVKLEKSKKFLNQEMPKSHKTYFLSNLPDCDRFTSWSIRFFLAITSASSFFVKIKTYAITKLRNYTDTSKWWGRLYFSTNSISQGNSILSQFSSLICTLLVNALFFSWLVSLPSIFALNSLYSKLKLW